MTLRDWYRCTSEGCHSVASLTVAGVHLCERHHAEVVAAVGGLSVVYYLRWRDRDEVKIGVTQNLDRRSRDVSRASGARVYVAATEPGGYDLERRRHLQFRSLRIPGTELFHCGPVLVQHIAALNRRARIAAEAPESANP